MLDRWQVNDVRQDSSERFVTLATEAQPDAVRATVRENAPTRWAGYTSHGI
jgi:hypothetical protein